MSDLDISILKPLSDGEDFRLAVGNEHSIFIVGRKTAIGSHCRPFVLEDFDFIRRPQSPWVQSPVPCL